MENKKVVIIADEAVARELYDFITGHLEVVNETPLVEELMMELEDAFELV